MNARRPHGDDLDEWLETYGGSVAHGGIAGVEHPWDWSDEVTEELADELEQQLARKIVPGFYVGIQKKYPAREENEDALHHS